MTDPHILAESGLATVRELAKETQLPLSWLYERTRHDALPGLRRLGKYVRICALVNDPKVPLCAPMTHIAAGSAFWRHSLPAIPAGLELPLPIEGT